MVRCEIDVVDDVRDTMSPRVADSRGMFAFLGNTPPTVGVEHSRVGSKSDLFGREDVTEG